MRLHATGRFMRSDIFRVQETAWMGTNVFRWVGIFILVLVIPAHALADNNILGGLLEGLGKVLQNKTSKVTTESATQGGSQNPSTAISGQLDSQRRFAFGSAHALYVTPEGKLIGWGLNNYGQLGQGTEERNTSSGTVFYKISRGPFLDPVDIQEGVTKVVGDGSFSIFLKKDGTVWAMGRSEVGELGQAVTGANPIPTRIPELRDIVDIAAGGRHAIALKNDGTVWVWGWNVSGILGIGNRNKSPSEVWLPQPIPGIQDAISVIGVEKGVYVLRSSGSVWSPNVRSSNFQQGGVTMPLTDVKAIFGAPYSSTVFAITQNGNVYAWGKNEDGIYGNGSKGSTFDPVEIPELRGVKSISVGDGHAMGLTSDGGVLTWGNNYFGQLGNSEKNMRTYPEKVTGLPTIKEIYAGRHLSVAVDPENKVYAWGSNDTGIIGKNNLKKPTLISLVPARATSAEGLSGLELVQQNFDNRFGVKPSAVKREITESLFEGMYLSVDTTQKSNPWLFNEPVNLFFDTQWRNLNRKDQPLSALEIDVLRKELMRSIKFDKLITYKYGNGEQKVVLFTSFDCPHCQRLEKMLDKIGPSLNMTIYLVPGTLELDNPRKLAVLDSIICAKDPKQTWRQLMVNNKMPPPASQKCAHKDIYRAVKQYVLPKHDYGSPTWLFQSGNYGSGVPQTQQQLKEFLERDFKVTLGKNVYAEPRQLNLRAYGSIP